MLILKPLKFFKRLFFLSFVFSAFLITNQRSFATILYDGDQTGGVTVDDSFTIDFDQTSVDRELRFGDSTIYFKWNGSQFQVSNDLDLQSNQLKTARVENVMSLPGGAGGLGVAGTGRIVQLTAIDAIAPGCTGPTCSPGTYSWDGTIWRSLQGSINISNATKIVTVGPVGRDYTNIPAAAAYLNTLSGGEMWIDPGKYVIKGKLDLRNIRLIGADTALTLVVFTDKSFALSDNTDFETLSLMTDHLVTDFILDAYNNIDHQASLSFDRVNLAIEANKVLVNSSSAVFPKTYLSFINSTADDLGGTIVYPLSSSKLDSSSSFLITNLSNTKPLRFEDWPVTIVGGSNVVTSGKITAIPDRTIVVSPGMNIQGAIYSLGSGGGVIKLLIGEHIINRPINFKYGNIEIVGDGSGSIIKTDSNWLGGNGAKDCVIEVGDQTGSNNPLSNVVLRNFTVDVGTDVHGVCIYGGNENKVIDMTVTSTSKKTTTHTGIVFTDGGASQGARFTASRNTINSNDPSHRWVDGIHFDGTNAGPSGLQGFGNGIVDSIISENIVYEAQQTCFAFAKVSASGIFSNRARDIGYDNGSLGMFFMDSTDVTTINNSMEGNNNPNVTGISLYDDVRKSSFIGNVVTGGPIDFANGIYVRTNTNVSNIFDGNQFTNVNNPPINNQGLNSKFETNHVRDISDPTVNDDISKDFDIGTMWINTLTQEVFASADSTIGSAKWVSLSNLTGTPSNTFTLDNDNTGGDIALIFGQALGKSLRWDSANSKFVLNAPLKVQGNVEVDGTLKVLEGGASPQYYTNFSGADQTGNINYTLPNAQGGGSTMLFNDGSGNLSWKRGVGQMLTFLAGNGNVNWGIPTSLTEFAGNTSRRIRVDLSNVTEARLHANVVTGSGGTNPQLSVQYSTDGITWNYLVGANQPTINVGTSNTLSSSAWGTINAGARGDIYLRVVGIRSTTGGSNLIVNKVQIEVR